ncbi:hypothetical protein ABFS82_04G130000 [Erythranthe guttata]
MAAAYAALVSLTHTIDQILDTPPTLHIIVDRKQIEILQKKADLLLDFLENYTSTRGDQEIEHLEMMIGDAAYAAEYIIEFNVMNQILAARSRSDREESSNLLFEGVEISIQEFLFIEKELVKFKKDMQRPNNYYLTTTKASSSSSSSRPLLPAGGKNKMVGFNDHMDEIMGALSTNESNLRIISIVGMGGIGKTTLAINVSNNPYIVEHFQLRAWFTVSQEYTDKKILLGLLHQINNTYRNAHEIDDDDDDYAIGDILHKTLFGRKYLIVMDDMWDIKACDMVKRFLPDNNNGSRILVTTRLMKLAVDIGSRGPYQLNLLEKSQSWDLLREKIFAEERCPDELEGTGKSIAKKCNGLPLALVVIAGVLAKSKTKEHWVSIEKDVTSAVNNQDDESCMKILLLSYNNLPIHLKPCFLYFAVFPEDHIIKVERLVRLWVAEGFIRQCGHKSLEEIGEEYLEDLIDRNLILVDWRSVTGEVTDCHIHDVLSNLCRREAQKDNFIFSFARKLYNPDILTFMKITPRLSINGGKWKGTKHKPYTSQIPTRSLLCFSKGASTDYTTRRFPLLRVLDVVDIYPKDEILQLIYSRYVSCMGLMMLPSSISRLWSLQTLFVDGALILPGEIWQMPQLRHVEANSIILPDPPPPDNVQKIILLENLQTLSGVVDFECSEAVINRIPNVKKLEIVCGTIGSNCLRNLGLLHKLEQLYLKLNTGTSCCGEIVFPSSLKELMLSECKIPWEDMSVVGSLPNLQVLELRKNAAIGQKWIPKEGEFTRLKFLWIHECELEIWEADNTHFPYNTHFPCLEQIHLGIVRLNEFPSDFAEILPLQVIDLHRCENSLLTSAKEVSKQRENLGYDALQIRALMPGLLRISVQRASSSSSSRPLLPACGKNSMVGFDNHMDEIMGALSTNESNLRIISIVGMGGIGKTTLATNVFNNPFIVEHFQLRAWFTVSQEYTDKKILLGLLHQISNTYRNAYEIDDDDDDDEDDDYEIGDRLHKTLFGRKYLIVMDDMWDIKAWDMVKRFLPDNSNGSRIFVTTRLMKLAVDIGSCSPYQLNLLEKSQSWDLLREKIFAEERCPDELEGTGKSIATKCRGLPLALVVIAGVLAKSKTKQHWVSIEKDVTSVVNNEDDEFCMKILLLSYNNLPIHLKPCFLYFAVFPEDHIIKAERLVRLWVAEGFIRQYGHKSLEEIGKEYLKDLIDRNLISVNWRSVTGEVTGCNIHDVLSNLCKREAQKDNFILSFARKLYNPDILTFMKFTPRLSINDGKWKGTKHKPYTSQIPTRSLLCFSKGASTDYTARRFPLLRVLDVVDIYPKDEILQLINSRYVSCMGEIWQMPQLRHVVANSIILPDPPPPDNVQKIILLENLQTLSRVVDFECTEAVINRIPNVKKLEIVCGTIGSNCLRNLGLLHKLEQLNLELITGTSCCGEIVFPSSLKELILSECKIPWEDMSVVGSLPNLQVLELHKNAAIGKKWIPKEGEFIRLKFLWINMCELEIWEADNTHFPCLVKLNLGYLNLKEIPLDFDEILPLRAINLYHNSSNDLRASANEISERRENLGYDALYVQKFTFGVLKIWVKRGINLAVGGGDPYVVITMGNQVSCSYFLMVFFVH